MSCYIPRQVHSWAEAWQVFKGAFCYLYQQPIAQMSVLQLAIAAGIILFFVSAVRRAR